MEDFDAERQLLEMLRIGDRYIPEPVCRLDRVFCGCGCPEEAFESVFDCLLDIVNDRSDPSDGKDWILLYLLDHLRFTEHGVSARCGWLTDDGMILLSFLCRWGSDWREEGRFISSEGVAYRRI